MTRRKIEHPWTRRAVIRDLALSGETQNEIGRRYGVASSTISAFAKKHAVEIEQVRAAAEDEFAGILLADKANRIRTYEALLEAAISYDRSGNIEGVDMKSAVRILRNIAEELGHLPARLQISGEMGVTTNYKINGVDVKDLM